MEVKRDRDFFFGGGLRFVLFPKISSSEMISREVSGDKKPEETFPEIISTGRIWRFPGEKTSGVISSGLLIDAGTLYSPRISRNRSACPSVGETSRTVKDFRRVSKVPATACKGEESRMASKKTSEADLMATLQEPSSDKGSISLLDLRVLQDCNASSAEMYISCGSDTPPLCEETSV